MASHCTSRGLPLFPLLPFLLALFLSSTLPSLATFSEGPLTDLLKDTEQLREAQNDTAGTPASKGEISQVTTDSEDILSGVSDATASPQRASTWRAGLEKRLSTKECEAFKSRLASSLRRTPTGTGSGGGSGSDSQGASAGAKWPPGEYRRRPRQCWSRAEWLCFATMAPGTKPSKNLEEMLKMYQRRVRECRVLEPPGKLRERLLAGTPTVCQYMLWSPTKDGLGNQMLSLASAFAYSLLTFRVLLVEPHNASVSHLFCEPFPHLPSWRFAHATDFGAAKVGSNGEVGGYRINTASDLDQPPPTVLSFHVHLLSDMQPFLCPEFHRWAQGASALVTSSVVFWLPGLYFIPHFRAKLEALFPSRRAYATLLPIILLPSNHIWEEATRFLVTKGPFALNPQGPVPPPSYGGLRVGIQFRQNFGVGLEEGVESVVQCYRKISKELKKQEPNLGPLSPQAPKASYAPSSPNSPEIFNGVARRFVDFFGDSGGQSLYRPKAVTMYLASLNGNFSQGVMEAMDKAGVEAEAVSLTKDKEQVFWDARHNEKALVDILSVALSSQALIVTPRSTFGYTIVGYSSAPAYFISPCERAMQEPCFLRPPNTVKCRYSTFEVEKGEIPGVSRPLLRSCPDALWLHQIGQYQLSDGVVVDNDALRI